MPWGFRGDGRVGGGRGSVDSEVTVRIIEEGRNVE